MSAIIKNLFINLTCSCFAITLGLAIAEIMCHFMESPETSKILSGGIIPDFPKSLIQGPNLFYETPNGTRMYPNTIAERHKGDKSWTIASNELGCRSHSIKNKHKPRILFIGDSITFAEDIREQDTFVKIVGSDLYAAGIEVETINCSISGLSLSDEVALLKEVIAQIKPDLVVYQYFLNDFQRSQNGVILNPPYYLQWSWLAQHSYRRLSIIGFRISKLLGKRFNRISNSTLHKWWLEFRNANPNETNEDFISFTKDYFDEVGASWSPASWRYMLPQLHEMKMIAENHSAGFMIISFPILHQLLNQWPNYPDEQLLAFTLTANVPLLKIKEQMQKQPTSSINAFYLTDDPIHLSELGHNFVSYEIISFLLTNQQTQSILSKTTQTISASNYYPSKNR
ncbi:MAG: SGNH/GDSL hydrolase family protein [Deltaproteobacteria bacterium]|nr:SGNH/GDSL hydrolase family protein [Deltaproteobacteria bacterium]